MTMPQGLLSHGHPPAAIARNIGLTHTCIDRPNTSMDEVFGRNTAMCDLPGGPTSG